MGQVAVVARPKSLMSHDRRGRVAVLDEDPALSRQIRNGLRALSRGGDADNEVRFSIVRGAGQCGVRVRRSCGIRVGRGLRVRIGRGLRGRVWSHGLRLSKRAGAQLKGAGQGPRLKRDREQFRSLNRLAGQEGQLGITVGQREVLGEAEHCVFLSDDFRLRCGVVPGTVDGTLHRSSARGEAEDEPQQGDDGDELLHFTPPERFSHLSSRWPFATSVLIRCSKRTSGAPNSKEISLLIPYPLHLPTGLTNPIVSEGNNFHINSRLVFFNDRPLIKETCLAADTDARKTYRLNGKVNNDRYVEKKQ